MRARQDSQQRTRTTRLESLHAFLAVDLLLYLTRRTDNPEDAADMLAETFAAAWRHIARLPEDDTEARMWMFGVARNVVRNSRRGRTRHSRLTEALREEIRAASVSTAPDTGGAIDVRKAVTALEEDLRELVVLIHWTGFTLPEAARIVGVKESTARGRYQRARQRLRTSLEALNRQPSGEGTRAP